MPDPTYLQAIANMLKSAPPTATPNLLGQGAAANAGQLLQNRGNQINTAEQQAVGGNGAQPVDYQAYQQYAAQAIAQGRNPLSPEQFAASQATPESAPQSFRF